jgi:hypothetical protein
MGNYAGVDWASEKHDVLVADASGGALTDLSQPTQISRTAQRVHSRSGHEQPQPSRGVTG